MNTGKKEGRDSLVLSCKPAQPFFSPSAYYSSQASTFTRLNEDLGESPSGRAFSEINLDPDTH